MGKRFNQLLLDVHELPMEEQMKALNKTIEDWKGTGTQTDDILVMGMKAGVIPARMRYAKTRLC